MRTGKLVAAAVALAAIAGLWAIRRSYSAPPEVPFAVARRETLVSTLSTNGKAEPWQFALVRTEREGTLQRLAAAKGQSVRTGDVLAELDESEARAELAAAEARLNQARAALEVLERGGREVELAEIDASLARARLELKAAERDYESLRRLVEKQAAASRELETAEYRLQRARAEIQGLETRRAALVSAGDRRAARARLEEAQATREQAARRLEQCRIRSPLSGIVYDLPLRRGELLRPGELVAGVGKLDPMRVRVYVDEPELGRLAPGLPVTISWDALPAKRWQGQIEQMPLQVTALGTRQVGEVLLTIENPNLDLLPGANVNAEIVTQVIKHGLIIPKEAVQRHSNHTGVYLLGPGDRLAWRAVKLGASSLTRVQVLEGLAEGDRVALGSDRPLREGLRVRPRLP